MIANVKYTVKYYPRPIRQVAKTLFLFSGFLFLPTILVLIPVQNQILELKILLYYLLPTVFYHLENIAVMILLVGGFLWLFKWRRGVLELTNEKIMIRGSLDVSIWLKNMWEVDVRNWEWQRRIIRLDSNVFAVEIKFKTEKDFECFSEKLIDLVEDVENIRISN